MDNSAQDATVKVGAFERLEGGLSKFHSLSAARSYSNHTTKASQVLHGDDGLYWVTTMAAAAKLEGWGYEIIK
jgi:photosystem II stability/assembly factor-like uncharacterized protein